MPTIYTHKTSGAAIGVYTNDDRTLEMIVEVRKKAGSALYTIVIDGNNIYGRGSDTLDKI